MNTCIICGKEFEGTYAKQQTCSKECYSISARNRNKKRQPKERACIVCGKKFMGVSGKFCSNECSGEYNSKEFECAICGKKFKSTKKNAKYCSNKCVTELIKKKNTKHSGRFCIECGKELKTNQEVFCGLECKKASRRKLFAKDVLRLYENGKTLKEIEDELHTTRQYIRVIFKENGVQEVDAYKNKRNSEYFKSFTEKQNKYTYVKGYETSQSKITIRCNKCGAEIIKSAKFIYDNPMFNCPICEHDEEDRKKAERELKKKKEQEEAIERKRLREKKRIDKIKAQEEKRKESLKEKECVWCGNMFVSSRRKFYCCDRCSRKTYNRSKEKRIYRNGEPDKSISLEKLYKRDKGICYLCGERVDMELDSNDNYYGSIEHVIPLSKGGLHSWDNVKLAHRICNTYKRDKLPPSL